MVTYFRPYVKVIFFKIKYVDVRDKYVNIQDIYVNMQLNYVYMQEHCNQTKLFKISKNKYLPHVTNNRLDHTYLCGHAR